MTVTPLLDVALRAGSVARTIAARSAVAHPIRSDVESIPAQRMSVRTVRAVATPLRRAPVINDGRYGLAMRWVHARPVAAEVVQLHASRNRADQKLVRETVSADALATSRRECPVALAR